ncbi:MAG: hypothetical protein V4592_14050 [Bacteroidota bacterium]
MTSDNYIKTGRITTIVSFIIGTLILVMYALSLDFGVMYLGILFIMLAGLTNVVVLILLLFKAVTDAPHRKKLLLTAGMMLINIPVLIFYLSIESNLSNTIRLSLNNSTKTVLTDIHINGCELNHIDKLAPNQSQTIRIKIPGDCAIDIDYLQNGIRKKASVADYVTNDGGQNLTYNIGGQNDNF